MSAPDFLQRFEEFLRRNGWPTDRSPWSIVEQWESLAEQAADDVKRLYGIELQR